MAFLFIMTGALIAIYVTTLYKIQIYDAGASAAELELPVAKQTVDVSLPAQRGSILDRNGTLLVSNRPAYSVTLSRGPLLSGGQTNGNSMIKEIVYTAEAYGVSYYDTLPITRGAPFEYIVDMSDSQRAILDKYFDYFSLEQEISASDLISWMRDHYKLDYTTGIADARLIIGIRYELEIRHIPPATMAPYVFADDVGVDFIAVIRERAYPGVDTNTASVREYHTPYAAHILGTTGKLGKGDVDKYTALGYPLDAVVGKSGVEAGFEQYLHGVDGAKSVATAGNGTVLKSEVKSAPEPGGNVYLSIDIGLQGYAENELAKFINTINTERTEESKVVGGAVVVTDVNTGEIQAMASYPTYDLSSYRKNFAALSSDPSNPLFDRATNGVYNPGSTFKMATALAGLRTGTIARWTQINDTGRYERYDTFRPYCWIYQQQGSGHGLLNVVEALRDSCNYFFFQVGDYANIDALTQAAMDFGLGVPTGIEIPEKTGTLATEDYVKNVLGLPSWVRGDLLLASIGQGHNMFTPLQMAGYAATIANGGTRHAMTILSKVKNADYSSNIVTQAPKTLGVIAEGDYIDILQEGMRAAAQSGTAAPIFRDFRVRTAAKTGTVQLETSEVNNGVFVCYAPADDPEIAISVVIEKGGSGSAVMEIARTLLDYYYRDRAVFDMQPEGALIP
jgi:penicillin-binding protein 2